MTINYKKIKTKFLYAYLPVYHQVFFRNKPVTLVNSIHKAGTHMLTNALAAALPLKYDKRGVYDHALTHTWPEKSANKNTSADTVIHFLEHEIWPGEIVRGHIEYDARLATYLAEKGILHVLIIRKPLDVMVSLANWWERHNEIPTKAFLTFKEIDNPEDRLTFLLTGQWRGVQVWPNLVERMNAFLGWQQHKHTLVLKYEDLLAQPQVEAVRLVEHLHLRFNQKKFLDALVSRNNRTFTRSEDKIHKILTSNQLAAYEAMGGLALETKMGYR